MTAPAGSVESARVAPRAPDPLVRLAALFDAGTLEPLPAPDTSGVVTARGLIDGGPVVAYCTDPARAGGALGQVGCGQVVAAIDAAEAMRVPVIGLWHSGGARLDEGVAALDGVGRMFAAMVRVSGRVPQLSVMLGPAAGGAAYGSALTDLVVMAPQARVFVTGPDVVRAVTGESVDQEALGGPVTHGRRSGVAHVLADSEADALDRARELTGYFARPGTFSTVRAAPGPDPARLLPDSRRRAYDVRPVVRALLDRAEAGGGARGGAAGAGAAGADTSRAGTARADAAGAGAGGARGGRGSFCELQATWAPNMVVGLGRLAGRSVGVVANNPLRLGGCLDCESAEKAARFVRLCDAFGIPLVVLVDVPGYLPGVDQEWGGIVRRGAKLLHAFAEATVPRATLVTRKAFGGAFVAMNSRALGASAVYAWPDAELAVMGAEAAVGILHRRTLAAAGDAERGALAARLAEEHRRTTAGLDRAVAVGAVDAVIEPARSREHLIEALACAPARRGAHRNIPL